MNSQEKTAQLADVSLPALMRSARQAYGLKMRAALHEVGCDDIPRHGMYIIGSIARTGAKNSEIIRGLGLSKQAASQLVDTLVLRGYITRLADPEDRRQMNIVLTERGELAARAARAASDKMDAQLLERVGKEHLEYTKETLVTIIECTKTTIAS